MLLTGAEILVKCLLSEGVDTIFGYPGGAVLNIYDYLYKYKDNICYTKYDKERKTWKIVLRKIESKCWALNVENGNQYRLNEVSYLILDSFRETATVENVIEIVGKEYAVDKERLIADCCLMIQTAVDKNILKEV